MMSPLCVIKPVWQKPCHIGMLMIVAILFMTGKCTSTEETNDIQSLLNDEEPVRTEHTWNLPDTKAYVGKLFTYTLGLKEQPGEYLIEEISHDRLPKWLSYNVESDQLEGVPTSGDSGEHYIAVIPKEKTAGMIKHFFTITVKGDQSPRRLTYTSSVNDLGRPKVLENCRRDDPVTLAKIILDTDLTHLDGADRAGIVKNIISHLMVNNDLLRLYPLGDESAYDKSALVAGPGNAQGHSYPGAVVSWQIGCGSVDAENMAILEKVESSARDGSMAETVGYPVVGWSVTNNRPQSVVISRKKRAIQATPVAEVSPPTKMSTDEKEPEDYFGATGSEESNRKVPVQASPKKTHHSKRTKTAGRHGHKKSQHPGPSKKYSSPMATPSMTPVAPTPVQMTSTSVNVGLIPVSTTSLYTTPSPEIPIYRTGIPIQPSQSILQPSTTSSSPLVRPTPTPVLPTSAASSTSSSSSSTAESTATKIKEITPTEETTISEPEVSNQVPVANPRVFRRVEGHFGKVLEVKIPADTFSDLEDGNTRNMKLMLLKDDMTVPRSHWLQLKKHQMLHGVLFQMGRHRKKEFAYELAAIDSGGKIARTAFQVVIKRAPFLEKINHEFTVSIDFDYKIFKDDPKNSIIVASKIAKLYGQGHVKDILITKLREGSVLFSWTNTSLRTSPCPVKEISRLLSYIVTESKTLNQTFVDIMRPYRIKLAGVRSLGACKGKDFSEANNSTTEPPEDENPPYTMIPPAKPDPKRGNVQDNDGMLVTTIIPAAVIAALILVAIIVACILYHKRRKGKYSHEDKHTFVNKGIPVIFADELEDKPDPPTKPLIMPEEKPPLPPPEYHRSGSIPPSPPSGHKDPIESTEDEHDDRDNSPPYQPPPPFMSGNDYRHHQRPRQVQSHRSPPPYVPP